MRDVPFPPEPFASTAALAEQQQQPIGSAIRFSLYSILFDFKYDVMGFVVVSTSVDRTTAKRIPYLHLFLYSRRYVVVVGWLAGNCIIWRDARHKAMRTRASSSPSSFTIHGTNYQFQYVWILWVRAVWICEHLYEPKAEPNQKRPTGPSTANNASRSIMMTTISTIYYIGTIRPVRIVFMRIESPPCRAPSYVLRLQANYCYY